MGFINNESKNRFEISLAEGSGFIEYEKDEKVLYLTHAEIPEGQRGKGIGKIVIKGILDELRDKYKEIVAECPAVKYVALNTPGYEFVTVD